jgi:hypothetical protein
MAYLDDSGGSDTAGPITTPVGGNIFAPGGTVSNIVGAVFGPTGARVVEGVNAFFGGGGTGGYPGYTTQLEGGGTSTVYGGDMTYGGGGGGGGGWRAGSAASVRSVIPRFLEGAAVAASVYAVYRELRGRGMGHAAAKKLAHKMHGIFTKRRRMKATNPRALRRAMRRIKGARKMFSKVRGLMGVHHSAPRGRWHRGRHRRGDLYESVENEQDTIDELLDDGYTPEEIESFFGGIG